MNLLENAIRHDPTGGDIVVWARADGTDAASSRSPTTGRASRSRTGSASSRNSSASTRPPTVTGTGLGLTIVRALTEANDGTVRYEDTPGGGATFVLTLPDRTARRRKAAMSAVLLIEDDRLLRRTVRASLHSWDFDVLEAESGEEALTMLSSGRPDLVILDLSLPGHRRDRDAAASALVHAVPVLVLTVRDGLDDKVTALDAGADDYMVKPFEPEELLARARAHLRRSQAPTPTQPAVVRSGQLEIDLARSLVTWDGEPVALTPTELRLLEVLLAHRGTLVTREKLLQAVWGSRRHSDLTRLRVFVLHLRRKLHDDAARPRLIFTEPGLGYRWIGEHEEAQDSDESSDRP